MDLKELAGALFRLWYLTVFVVLLSLGAGWAAMQVVGARYSAVSTAVLIPPQSTVQAAAERSNFAPPNPLLYLSGLTQSRDVVLRKLMAQDVARGIDDRFPGTKYEASNDALSSGPLMVVTVDSGTSEGALGAQSELQDTIPVLLRGIQDDLDIASTNQITALQLTADQTPSVERKTQMQIGVFATGGVMMFGLLLLAFLDSMLRSRSRLRLRHEDGTGGDAPVDSTRRARQGLLRRSGNIGARSRAFGGQPTESGGAAHRTERELVMADSERNQG